MTETQTSGAFLLRIAGVNFDSTMADTQDLQTIRGASLAYLLAPAETGEHLRAEFPDADIKTIYVGASEGAFEVADADPDRIVEVARAFLAGGAGDRRPYGHLTFTVAATPMTRETYRAATDRCLRQARVAQLQTPTCDLPFDAPATGACAVDGIRPATVDDHGPDGRPRRLSASVAARRAFGRQKRALFYAPRLSRPPAEVPDVAQSFADIVADPPDGVPENVAGKMAILYMDGNRFGRIRQDYGGRTADMMFSQELQKMQNALLAAIVDHCRATPGLTGVNRQGEMFLRVDTLLWGGDEMLFVMPAWAVWDLVGVIAAQTRDWEFVVPLHHSAGLVICDEKAPIRAMRGLAETLADAAKRHPEASLLQYEVLEGIDLPFDALDRHRDQVFAGQPADGFSLDMHRWADVTTGIRLLKRHFPRSQLYRHLRGAVRDGHLSDRPAAAAPEFATPGARLDALRDQLGAYGAAARPPCDLSAALFASGLGRGGDASLMPLVHLAALWDYVPEPPPAPEPTA